MPDGNALTPPVFVNRGEQVSPTETVRLRASFQDGSGNPVDLDSYPNITIIQPSGSIAVGPTSSGISREDVGKYLYEYPVGIGGPLGIWTDTWMGSINGFGVSASFNFVVNNGQEPGLIQDGYETLGSDVGFHYSQEAIRNINKLLKLLSARMSNKGKAQKIVNGNTTYVDCDIFSTDELVTFLAGALSDFNQVPYFTFFTFDDHLFIKEFTDILVEGATLTALAVASIRERGKEFNVTDQGISYVPPSMSELLNSQYGVLLQNYWDKLKYIKNSMRPEAKSLGTLSITSSNLPIIKSLRLRRAGRVF